MKTETRKSLTRGFVVWLGVAGYALQKYVGALDSLADWDWFEFSKGAIEIALVGVLMLIKFFGGELPERTPGKRTVVVPPSRIDMTKLRNELVRDEGVRDEVYEDSLGNRTAGIGHLLIPSDKEYTKPVGTPVPKTRIDSWFASDITKAIADARSLVPQLETHPPEVVRAVINMAFNLGRKGLGEFRNTLKHINAREYQAAALESQNSLWADQVGARSDRIAAALSGAEPDYKLA